MAARRRGPAADSFAANPNAAFALDHIFSSGTVKMTKLAVGTMTLHLKKSSVLLIQKNSVNA